MGFQILKRSKDPSGYAESDFEALAYWRFVVFELCSAHES